MRTMEKARVKCSLCNYLANSRKVLVKHFKTSHKLNFCTECDDRNRFSCYSFEEMSSHLISEHDTIKEDSSDPQVIEVLYKKKVGNRNYYSVKLNDSRTVVAKSNQIPRYLIKRFDRASKRKDIECPSDRSSLKVKNMKVASSQLKMMCAYGCGVVGSKQRIRYHQNVHFKDQVVAAY